MKKAWPFTLALTALAAQAPVSAFADFDAYTSSSADILMIYGSGLPGGTTEFPIEMRRIADAYEKEMKVALVRDTEVYADDLRRHTLLALGSPSDNTVIRMFQDRIPATFSDGGFEFGGKRYGEDRGLAMAQPNPLDARYGLLLFLAGSYSGLDALFSVPLGPTDFVIASRNTIQRQGFFVYGQDGRPSGIKTDTDLEGIRDKYLKSAILKRIERFEYHYVPGSRAERDIDRITRFNGKAYADLQEFFALKNPPRPIRYYFYESIVEKDALTGNDANAHNDFNSLSVHAAYGDKLDTIAYHELAHLFASAAWGKAGTRLMGEGLAVSFDGTWWSKRLAYWGGTFWRESKVPSLQELAAGTYWQEHESEAYALAGNLFAYLRSRYPRSQVKEIYVSRFTPTDVEEILGTTWPQLERGWNEELAREASAMERLIVP